MSPLNIHPEETVTSPKKKNNKTLKIMLGIGALVLVPVIGTTLASQITVNTGSDNVTFGQGQKAAIACDSTITLIPEAGYVEGEFLIQKITVTSSNLDPCEGNTVIVSAADTTGALSEEIGLVAVGAGDDPIAAKATLTQGSEGCDSTYFTCTYTPAVTNGADAKLEIIVKPADAIDATLIGNMLIQQTS